MQSDQHGATVVLANGYQWTRRNGSGKFGPAIWFSRADGLDDSGAAPEALRVPLPPRPTAQP